MTYTLEESLRHLNFLQRRILSSLILYQKRKDLTVVQFFALGLIERIDSAIGGLVVLLEGAKQNDDLLYSVGLILRTSILDFLICLRAHDVSREGMAQGKTDSEIFSEIEQYCNRILGSGLQYSTGYIAAAWEAGLIDDQRRDNLYSLLSQKYPLFLASYQNDGVRPKVISGKAPQAVELFKALGRVGDFAPLARNYDTYAFLSKLEHFGIESYDALRMLPTQKESLFRAVELLLMHYYLCLELLMTSIIDRASLERPYQETMQYLKETLESHLPE